MSRSEYASPDAVGIIYYRLPTGETRKWGVGCHLFDDNEETLKAHLKKWKPDAIFMDASISPVHPITSTPNAAPITAIPMGKEP